MAHGYNGKILVVDLTAGTHEIKEPGERWYRTYFGGSGIIAETLLSEDISGVDPLGPENVLILACSVVTGAPISGFNRFSVGAKSVARASNIDHSHFRLAALRWPECTVMHDDGESWKVAKAER